MARHYFAKRIVAFVIVICIFFSTILLFYNFHETDYPRRLEVGDTWSYTVIFPDSHEYALAETVQARLANETYLILRDDSQHLSTGYLWLTSSWYETRESQVQIGNLEASSSLTYNPPIELIHIPLHVGDEWEVSSNLTTQTVIRNQTRLSISLLHQLRKITSEEPVHTPIGLFQSFRVSVFTGRSLYETLWFSVELGQVVYAKFYNPLGESVTETLTGYHLATISVESSLAITSNSALPNGTPTEVLCISRPTLSTELKNPYD